MLIFTQNCMPICRQYCSREITGMAILLLFLTFENSWGAACRSYCRRAGCSARLHSVTHQRQHGKMRWLLKRYYSELNSTVKSTGSAGDTVTVTCGLKPPLTFDVWISCYLICCCSFKSAWQDKTANRFPIRTLTAQQRDRHPSQASSKLPSLPLCMLHQARRWITYWFGAF